jgi:hypothetical protein
MVALGRPNREQVVTVRQAGATTLQALELTNGGTLAALLRQGATKIVADASAPAGRWSRRSTARRSGALRLPAKPASPPAWSAPPPGPKASRTLLWALTMLPEFQLIR